MTDFHTLAAEDPLCAAEGLDLASAEGALEALEREARKFESVLTGDSWRRALYFFLNPLTRTAVPVPFLRALIASERARRAYLAQPSPSTARALARAWVAAARAYGAGVAAYRGLFERIVREEPSLARKTLHDMAGNSYTIKDVADTIATMEKNARELMREARLRAAGKGDLAPTWRGPRDTQPPAMSAPYQMLEELEEERLAERYEIAERYGPFGYVAPHFSGLPRAHRFVVQLGRNRRTDEPYVNFHLADRCAFLPLTGGRMGRLSASIFQPLIDRGIGYFGQQLTWFYAIRDQQYQPELLAIVERTRRPELDHRLVGAQRASLFDRLVWRHVDDLRRLRQMSRLRAREGDRSYSMGYAFFTHSNSSIYFMLFNRSVWRLEPVSLLGSGRTPEKDRVYLHLEEIQPPLSRTELRDVVRAGIIRRQAWKEQGLDLDE